MKKRKKLLKTERKKIMTRKEAVASAIELLSTVENSAETIEVLKDILTRLNLRSPISEEKKAEISEKRKNATAAARAELIEKVAPVLRKYLTAPMTAKELYEAAKAELPTDFSWQKVQNILIRELAPELDKVEAKGKPNTYQLKG